jgi:hypothetical protein
MNTRQTTTYVLLATAATMLVSSGGLATILPSPVFAQDETIVQQGTLSSTQDPLPGHEQHQATIILPPKEDGSIYTGILTFTASKPVEVVVLHAHNKTAEGPGNEFGSILKAPFNNNSEVAITLIKPDYGDSPAASASIPFAGNALALHTLGGDRFTATYTVTAQSSQTNSTQSQ